MKPITIPKLKDQSTRLAELEERRVKLAAQLTAVERERMDLGRSQEDNRPSDAAAARVAELMGEAVPKIEPGRLEQLAKLATDARDLRSAVDLIDNQIRVERTRASAIVREKVGPEYVRRVKAIAEALRNVHGANLDLQQLKDALEAEGVEWSGLGVIGFGHPRDPNSSIARFFNDASSLGFIPKRDVPEEFQPK